MTFRELLSTIIKTPKLVILFMLFCTTLLLQLFLILTSEIETVEVHKIMKNSVTVIWDW